MNPFDQFDEAPAAEAANPFDQFDERPDVKASPAQSVTPPTSINRGFGAEGIGRVAKPKERITNGSELSTSPIRVPEMADALPQRVIAPPPMMDQAYFDQAHQQFLKASPTQREELANRDDQIGRAARHLQAQYAQSTKPVMSPAEGSNNRAEMRRGDRIGPVTQQPATAGNVAAGIRDSVLKTGPEYVRQGLRAQFADAIRSPEMAQDAIRKTGQANIEEAAATPQFDTATGQALYGGAVSIGKQIPAVAASIATRSTAPMLAAAGLQTEAEAYGKYRERGATPGQAITGALGEGATEVATEMLPMGFLVKKFGKAGAGEMLSGLLAREVPGEQVATLVQDAIDTAVANPDKSWSQYAAERPGAAYQTLIATLLQSGVMAGAGAIATKMSGAQTPSSTPLPPNIPALAMTDGPTVAGAVTPSGPNQDARSGAAPLPDGAGNPQQALPDIATAVAAPAQLHNGAIDDDTGLAGPSVNEAPAEPLQTPEPVVPPDAQPVPAEPAKTAPADEPDPQALLQSRTQLVTEFMADKTQARALREQDPEAWSEFLQAYRVALNPSMDPSQRAQALNGIDEYLDRQGYNTSLASARQRAEAAQAIATDVVPDGGAPAALQQPQPSVNDPQVVASPEELALVEPAVMPVPAPAITQSQAESLKQPSALVQEIRAYKAKRGLNAQPAAVDAPSNRTGGADGNRGDGDTSIDGGITDGARATATASVRGSGADSSMGDGSSSASDQQQATAALSSVDEAAHQAAPSPQNDLPEPTDAMKRAGNYKLGHARIAGLDISIENPQGSTRRGTDPNGKAWESKLTAHYGYVKGTTGADGDHVDIFVKAGTPDDYSGPVFVIDQKKANGQLDEHKIVMGPATEAEARELYQSNYAKGWDGIRAITQMDMPAFKEWIANGDHTKAAAPETTAQKINRALAPKPAKQESSITAEIRAAKAKKAGATVKGSLPVEALDMDAAAKTLADTFASEGREAAQQRYAKIVKDQNLTEPQWIDLRKRFMAMTKPAKPIPDAVFKRVDQQIARQTPDAAKPEQAAEEEAPARGAKGKKASDQASAADEGVKYSVASKRTDTPDFRKWFGDSKVVDADGKPLVVYHGTGSDFDAFDPEHVGKVFNDDKEGFFFSGSALEASRYAEHAGENGGGNVMPVYLRMENPYTFSDYAFNFYEKDDADAITDGRLLIDWVDREKDSFLPIAISDGHDGVFLKRGKEIVAIAFSPEQIKSAVGNRGTFDPNDADIRHARDGAAAARDLFASSDPQSTVEDVRTQLAGEIGSEKASKIHVVQSIADLPGEHRKGAFESQAMDLQGLYDPKDGSIYLVADNIAQGEAFAVLMHEAGVHLGMRDLIGDANMRALASQLKLWSALEKGTEHGDLAKRALDRIPADTKPAHRDEELIAYFVTEAVKAGHGDAKKGPIARWFAKLWQAVKDAIAKLGADPSKLTTADVVALARGALEKSLGDTKTESRDGPVMASAEKAANKLRKTPINQDSQVTALFTALAKFDDAFQQPTSTEKDPEGIAMDIDPGYKVEKLNDSYASDWDKDDLPQVWQINSPRSEDGKANLYDDGRFVWIDVSGFKAGESQGNKMYGIAAAYAHNNGKVFTGDPMGLSPVAFFRRLENMISSALKFGTTDHLAPHKAQTHPFEYFTKEANNPAFAETAKEFALDWKAGDFSHNLKSMLTVSYNAARHYVPELEHITYDFDRREFIDTRTGEGRSGAALSDIFRQERNAGGTPARYFGGSSTAARTVLFGTLVRGAGKAGWPGVVASLSRQLQRDGLDPALKRILYSRAPVDPKTQQALKKAGLGNRPGLIDRVRSAFSSIADSFKNRTTLAAYARQGLLDQFYGLLRAERATVGNLPAEQSAYVAARLSTGSSSVMRGLLTHGAAKWAANGQHLEKIDGTKGLLEILGPVKDDIDNWMGWMIGNRAARLIKEGKENNFTQEDIDALKALGDGNTDRFRAVAREFAAFKRSVLDIGEKAGLIDADSRKVWDHADWIPFYREREDGPVGAARGKRGLSGQASGIRTLKGGTDALNDPLENILLNFNKLIDSSLKNNALRKFVRNVEGSDVLEKIGYSMQSQAVPKDQIRKELIASGVSEQVLNTMPAEVFDGMAKMWAIQAPTDPEVIRIMDNGKPEFYRVHDPLALQALTSMAPYDFPGMKIMRAFKRVLTSTTTATPAFMARNFIRDTGSSIMISRNRPAITGAIRGLIKSWKQEGGYEDMTFAGASFAGGYIDAGHPEEAARAIRRSLRTKGFSAASADKFMASIIDNPIRLWEKYREIGEAVENANREAIFADAKRAGKSDTEAAFESKDLMDFSLRGSWQAYQMIADVTPFFNARVQGLYRLGRSNPRALVLRGALLLTLPSVLLALSNAGNEEYEELPDWDKDSYWHFFTPVGHYRIPKPFEVGVAFATLPERVTATLVGKDSPQKLAARMWWNISEQLNLLEWPQFMKPVIENWANKDSFTGRQIENDADEGKLPHLRYNTNTSDTMRLLVGALGEGADKVGFSPKKAEHLVSGYLGSVGTAGLALLDMMARSLEGAAPRASTRLDEYPLIGTFYREDPAKNTQFVEDLYRMAGELNKVLASVKALERNGQSEEAAELYEKYKDKLEGLGAQAIGGAKAMTAYTRAIDAIQKDRTMTSEEKRREISKLQKERNADAAVLAKGALPSFGGVSP